MTSGLLLGITVCPGSCKQLCPPQHWGCIPINLPKSVEVWENWEIDFWVSLPGSIKKSQKWPQLPGRLTQKSIPQISQTWIDLSRFLGIHPQCYLCICVWVCGLPVLLGSQWSRRLEASPPRSRSQQRTWLDTSSLTSKAEFQQNPLMSWKMT